MIEIIKAKDIKNDKKVLELLTPYFRRWFEKRFNGKLTLPQKYSIPLIKKGENVLITSPTGSGKTLACFAAILDYLFRLAEKNELEDKVYCIYISPLRALDNDIKRNLEVPLKEVREIAEKEFGINLQEIRIAIRTGDTKASEKQKQLKYPPHILITTPETLAIILNSIKFKEKLKDVKFVIVDEVHELANSKRGVHLTLSLERLENFVGKSIQRIGAGATLHPIEEAAKFLVGVNRSCKIIDARFVKQTDLKVLIPAKNLILEKAEEINKKMYKLIDKLVEQHRTTLIFTNTRSGAERVHWHLKQLFPSKYLDEITGVHHSSVSRDIRFEIEEKLKRGEIKVVVCVSGDSIVWTENGPKKIRDIKNSEKVLSIDKNLKVSFSRFEKLFSSDYSDLAFEIETENGMKIKCTSFHKFLSIENSRLVWKTAEELKVGDYVGVVRKLETKEEKINILEVLPDGYYIEIEPEFLQHLKKVIKEKFGTLKNFSKNLNIKYETLKNCLSGNNAMNIRIFKEIVKRLKLKISIDKIKGIRSRRKRNLIRILEFEEKLSRLLGFWMADGCLTNNTSIRVFSKDKELLLKYRDLVSSLGINSSIFKTSSGIFGLNISSKPLYLLFKKLVGKRKKSKYGRFPKILFRLRDSCKKEFLAGYFDGDGFFEIKNGKIYSAGFVTSNKNFAHGIKDLLLSLGIVTSLREKQENSLQELNGRIIKKIGTFYTINIFGGEYLRKFFSSLNIWKKLPEKVKLVEDGYTNRDVLPNLSEILREIRNEINLSTYQLQKMKFYNPERVEIGEKNISRRNLIKLVNLYEKYLKNEKIEFLKKLANSDIFFVKIKKKVPIFLRRIYSLVNVDSGNYIINGFICKNSSTSLELGIDIGYIDLVIQIGSAKSVSRLMQRIGRAGHSLHAISKGRIICLDRDDLVENVVMVAMSKKYWLDKFHMPKNCLDVLAQHLVGMACEKKWNINEAYELVKRAYPFKDLSYEDFLNTLKYLAGYYHTLEDYNVYGKIWLDLNEGKFGRKKASRVIYTLNVGTIPEEVKIKVKTLDGKFCGFIEEGFLERLNAGDIFVLGGKTYEFIKAIRDVAYVKEVKEKRPTIPSWFSEQLPLNFDLAIEVGKFREKMFEMLEKKVSKKKVLEFLQKEYFCEKDVAKEIYEYFELEYKFLKKHGAKKFPSHKVVLVESFFDDRGQNFVFHTLYGRRVNDALSRAYAYALSKYLDKSIRVSISDNGFILTIPIEKWYRMFGKKEKVSFEEVISLVNSKNFEELVRNSLKNTELIKRKFRHVASRSFMILRNYKGHEISLEKQQMSAERLIKIVHELGNDFPVLKETYREILEDFMDLPRAKEILEKIENGEIEFEYIESDIPSPFAHNLIAISESDVVLMEDRRKLILKLYKKVLEKIES